MEDVCEVEKDIPVVVVDVDAGIVDDIPIKYMDETVDDIVIYIS